MRREGGEGVGSCPWVCRLSGLGREEFIFSSFLDSEFSLCFSLVLRGGLEILVKFQQGLTEANRREFFFFLKKKQGSEHYIGQ